MRRVHYGSILAAATLGRALAMPAAADFKVQYPDAETGEFAIEPIGDIGHDPLAAHSGELSSAQEFEYGVNSFWRTELELEQERDAGPGESIHFSQVTWENIFQFTERGNIGWIVDFSSSLGKLRWLIRRTKSRLDRSSARNSSTPLIRSTCLYRRMLAASSPREGRAFSMPGRPA